MCVFLLVLVLFWAVTRANAGHHLPSLEARIVALLLGPHLQTPSVSLQTFLWTALHPACDLPCHSVGRVQLTKVSKGEEVKQKYVKFWRGEKNGRRATEEFFLLCLSQPVNNWDRPSLL